jgi:hypothetical protein
MTEQAMHWMVGWQMRVHVRLPMRSLLRVPAGHTCVSNPYYEWSNGQVEGMNRSIKRQMYGRAKFDLLRLRVLYRPWVGRRANKPSSHLIY